MRLTPAELAGAFMAFQMGVMHLQISRATPAAADTPVPHTLARTMVDLFLNFGTFQRRCVTGSAPEGPEFNLGGQITDNGCAYQILL